MGLYEMGVDEMGVEEMGTYRIFIWVLIFVWVLNTAYKLDVVVVIKMGAYIHGVLILCGCLLSRFYGTSKG